MKTFIIIPALALMMLSCKKDDDKAVTDQSALKIAALEQQLEEQKLQSIKQNAIDSMQMINELKLPMAIEAAPTAPAKPKVVYIRERKKPVSEAPAAQAPISTPPIVSDSSTGQGSIESAPAATPEPEKKKGWSNTAKGAVIGAGVGAIGGAVIHKKDRVKGAVIGAVIGGAAGAGTGIILDRKKKRESEYIY